MKIAENISSWLMRSKKSMIFLSVFILILLSLKLNKVHISGELTGFDLKGNKLYNEAKEFDSLFGHFSKRYYFNITPKTENAKNVWKSILLFEKSLKKISDHVQIISPRKFAQFKYAIDDTLALKTTSQQFKEIKTHPEVGNLISKDTKSLLVIANFSENHVSLDSIDQIINCQSNEFQSIDVMSLNHLSQAIEHSILKDIIFIASVICIFFALYIYWVYRSFSALFFATLMMGTSIWMSFCLISTLGYSINLITVLVLPIILVISLSDAIHLLSGLKEESDHGKLIATYILPSLFSSLTTSAAFFSFYFSESTSIQQLGMITGVGLILEFILSFSMAPFLLQFVKIRNVEPVGLFRLNQSLIKYRKPISLLLVLMTISSVFLIGKLKFKSDTDQFFPTNSKIEQAHQRFNQQFFSQLPFNLYFENSKHLPKVQFLNLVSKITDSIKNHTLVLNIQSLNHGYDWQDDGMIDIGQMSTELQNAMPFVSTDSNFARCEVNFKNSNDAVHFYHQAMDHGIISNPQLTTKVSSNALILEYVNHSVSKTLFTSLLTSGLAIFLMLFLITKSIKQAIIALIPNFVPLSFVVLVFSIFGYDLNILTAITAVVCLGLLDDDTVHLLYRQFVLKKPIKSLSFSIINTSILLAVGFGCLILSDFYPTRVFGAVSAMVFLFGILGELTLFQYIIEKIRR